VTDDIPLLEPHRVYDRVGGLDAFETLVEAFYRRVEDDPLLRPIYPDDLGPGKRALARFLAQYFGGGDLYSREKGHPRLRMRHAPFAVTPEAALRWATLMGEAIREQCFDADVEQVLATYVAHATPTLVNALPDGADPLPRA
jgi:hemoglobin